MILTVPSSSIIDMFLDRAAKNNILYHMFHYENTQMSAYLYMNMALILKVGCEEINNHDWSGTQTLKSVVLDCHCVST